MQHDSHVWTWRIEKAAMRYSATIAYLKDH